MTRGTPIPETVTLHVPFRSVKRGGRKEMQMPDGAMQPRRTDSTLVKALARASWKVRPSIICCRSSFENSVLASFGPTWNAGRTSSFAAVLPTGISRRPVLLLASVTTRLVASKCSGAANASDSRMAVCSAIRKASVTSPVFPPAR